jgi:hypothetical protein
VAVAGKVKVTVAVSAVPPTLLAAKVVADGRGNIPTPPSAAVYGVPPADSETVPVRVPVAVGAKSTEIEHVAPATTEFPEQVSVGVDATAKFAETVAALSVTAAELVFVTVTVCTAEADPIGVGANVTDVGL